jgi:hypothetical protein
MKGERLRIKNEKLRMKNVKNEKYITRDYIEHLNPSLPLCKKEVVYLKDENDRTLD